MEKRLAEAGQEVPRLLEALGRWVFGWHGQVSIENIWMVSEKTVPEPVFKVNC